MSECEQGRKRERRGEWEVLYQPGWARTQLPHKQRAELRGLLFLWLFLFFLLHSVLILLHWPREHSEEERKGGKIEELEEKERDKWITLSWRNRVQKSERDNSRHTFPCAASSCAYISCWVCVYRAGLFGQTWAVWIYLARLKPWGWPAGRQGEGSLQQGLLLPSSE